MKGVLKNIWGFMLDTLRGFYPFLVCTIGGALVAVAFEQTGMQRLVPFIVACCAFVWALDMAETRAKAKARSEWAQKVLSSLLTGNDTTISVVISDERRAAE